jgi:Mrp family chromosome partitioning ATPase/capsular polysaccharide biosynthesis protein
VNAVDRYIYHLQRWWVLVAFAALIAGLLSFAVASTASTSYEATTKLLVTVSTEPGGLVLDDLLVGERLTTTYTALITTRPVLEDAAEQLGGPETAGDLEGQVSAEAVVEAQLVEVTATADTPERAEQIADTVAAVFIGRLAEAQAPPVASPGVPTPVPGETTEQTAQSSVAVVESASASSASGSTSVALRTIAGALAGASLILILLAGRAYFDSSVWSPEDVRGAGLQLPCLGVLTKGSIGGSTLLTSGRAIPTLTEPCRTMATTAFSALSRLEYEDNGTQAVALVSAVRGEGRTSLVARLGVAAAMEGKQVTLIDFDLRRPQLHEQFKIPNNFGITDAMWSGGSPRALIESSTAVLDRLRVIPCGQDPSVPARRLSAVEVSRSVDQLKSNGTDFLFFDTPPLADGTEAVVLGPVLDAAIIVVEARKTTVESISEVSGQMEALGLSVLGYVLNKR